MAMNKYSAGPRRRNQVAAGFAAMVLLVGTRAVFADGDAADDAMAAIRPEAIRADMRFLADDLLEGRRAGTRGHEIAAKFVASQFETMGLEPMGENGTYFQSVPLRSIRPDENQTTLTIELGGKTEVFVFRQDFIAGGDAGRTETSVEAPVVYVGFGVTAPEKGYDDYRSVDLKGKIVAYQFGAPTQFETATRAHYSSEAVKTANAAAHGAVGVISLDSPALEQLYPFKEQARDLEFPHLRWLDVEGRPNDYFPELRGAVFLSMDGVMKLLEGSGKSPDEIYAEARAGRPVSFALPVTAKMHLVTRHEGLESPNVVARLEGSDPKLRDEYIVYTAHLDHLGIGEPVNGDKIYNGALDNASGTACLLGIAKAFSKMNPRPKRSILFVSVTGEEEGLLGSDYFAHYPNIRKEALVANINMDGAGLLWPIEDVIVNGAEHSTLGEAVQEAAERLNLGVSPDPYPEQVLFIRSDQYSFVKQGIPAVWPRAGLKSSNPNIRPAEIRKRWVETIYHKPQDDMNQRFDFVSGAKYARYSFLLGYIVARKTDRPKWNAGDFFGEHYAKK
jgi:hypothetical protein